LAGFTAKYWLADFYVQAGGEENLIKAVRFNINRTDYQMRLVKNYLNKIRGEMLKPKDSRDSDLIQKAIDDSFSWAKIAVKIRPYSVANQEILAIVYRDVKSFTQGNELWTVKTFEQAFKLEPSNPVLLTELGKAYFEAEMMDEAEKSFLGAIKLKSDYRESDFGLAQVYAKKGENEKALAIFSNLAEIYNNEQVFYERGKLFYNEGETDKAMEDFLRVLEINSSHSNAMYSIGLALEKKGEKDLALKYFKKVQELNPDSLEIKQKIDELEKK
jgi:tetratricopeptide (TPR) repeat protein